MGTCSCSYICIPLCLVLRVGLRFAVADEELVIGKENLFQGVPPLDLPCRKARAQVFIRAERGLQALQGGGG